MINQPNDRLGSLFKHRARRIDRVGNPLLELEAQIDREAFRPVLDRVRRKARQSSAGRKPWDDVLMFKALVLGDEQLEFQIEDRRRFQRFMGLSDAKHAPDRIRFRLFRESLKELKLTGWEKQCNRTQSKPPAPKKKQPRRERFLAERDRAVPWDALLAVIEP